ncbi:hypothetical protein B0A52_02843 [Exophiala mesophila]|uniref:Xylanolytic transcriptional activator regulatory domain-containing protein n=1 Tax=Exophiala mesophila TaxID=212818 RepID=A0A438NDT6_EXOME|nr:hypothetical protein B0A52_02843 [Exophiala mesophila]
MQILASEVGDRQQSTNADSPAHPVPECSPRPATRLWSQEEGPPIQITDHDRADLEASRLVKGHSQQNVDAWSLSTAEESTWTAPTNAPRSTASDVMDTNLHTSNLEFYGSSSSVAFLRHVETLANRQASGPPSVQQERSMASRLHNTEFQPGTSQNTPTSIKQHTGLDTGSPEICPFRVARRFLDSYFSNTHQIQPLFEEDDFLARCEDMWFNRQENQPLSFLALYYAILSMGSLVMPFGTPEIAGADRFTWSRRLFDEALANVTKLGTTTDLEIVQCFFMLAKVCQHELNPHLAYLYSGQAARTALAIGINRKPAIPDPGDPRASSVACKTWWAIYCLDIQTSFALGRPDSLGPDQYHTQDFPLPTVTNTTRQSLPSPHVVEIVPPMVSLSRIMREVALNLYTVPCDMNQKLARAKKFEAELEQWLEQVPTHFQPDQQSTRPKFSLKPTRLPSHIKKQSVVLRLRYLNLRMMIHAVFMAKYQTPTTETLVSIRDHQCQCLQTAQNAIDLMFETFCEDDFFQTWWYNATYALFSVSIMLAGAFYHLARTPQQLDDLFGSIDRAVMVLQAMDECVVARNSTAIVKRTLGRAKKIPHPALLGGQRALSSSNQIDATNSLSEVATDPDQTLVSSHTDNSVPPDPTHVAVEGTLTDLDDWLNAYPPEDSQQSMFWTQWAHDLDQLGT